MVRERVTIDIGSGYGLIVYEVLDGVLQSVALVGSVTVPLVKGTVFCSIEPGGWWILRCDRG